MSDARNLNKILSFHPHLLNIRGNASFGKIIGKIKKSKNIEFVYVTKPKPSQMAAVLLSKILGKKILWIQKFENPPSPNFITKLLLSQADKIIVENRKEANKLKSFGIAKSKINVSRQSF